MFLSVFLFVFVDTGLLQTPLMSTIELYDGHLGQSIPISLWQPISLITMMSFQQNSFTFRYYCYCSSFDCDRDSIAVAVPVNCIFF